MDYCDDSDGYEYLIPVLASRGVNFIVSPKIDGGLNELSTLIQDGTDSYVREMMRIGRNAGLM
ncbi:hypothetical protein [Atlantibacter hermannii]|nr:hypothetical protein [Atlantibacter hermannii]